MAFWGDFSQGSPANQNPGADQSVGITDVGKEALASTAGLVSQAAGTSQYLADQANDTDQQSPGSMLSQGINQLFAAGQGYIQSSESDAAKDAQRNPLHHPLGYAMLQGAGLAPAVGLFALAPEGVAANAILGGGVQANQVVGDAISRTNSMNDDQLKQASPVYAKMRDQGMSEYEARTNLNKLQIDGGQVLAALAAGGVGGGVLGPALHGSGMTSGNILSRTAAGAAEGGVAMGAMAGDSDYSAQQQNVASGAQKDIDWAAVTNAALQGGATGAIMGGLSNATFGRAEKSNKVEVIGTPTQPDAAQDMALNASLGNPTEPPPQAAQQPDIAVAGASEAPSQPSGPIRPGRAPRTLPDTDQAAGMSNSNISGRSGAPAPPPNAGDTSISPTGDMSNPVTPGNISSSQEPTVPETQSTLQAQRQQLLDGDRSVMLFPVGNTPTKNGMGDLPSGMQRIFVPKVGTFDFDPTKVSDKDIRQAAKDGRLNDILGLGSTSKEEAVASAQAGAEPVAVTERQPDGTEVKAAAGTTDTAPTQQAELEEMKSPGNTVQVEDPRKVLLDRMVDGQTDPAAGSHDVLSVGTDTQPTAGDQMIQASQPAEASPASEPLQEPAPGTRAKPIKVNKAADMKAARKQVNHEATSAQKEADNYAKGHVDWKGMPITIETAKGETRTASDGSWMVPDFPADYGYFKGTKGADGDHVDVFVGPVPESNRVFVIDQRDPTTGKFDEHKVMVGFGDAQSATDAYDRAFTDGSGPARRGATTETTVAGLKDWVKTGDTTKPFTQRDVSTPDQRRASVHADMTQRGSTKNWTKDELTNFVKAEDIFKDHPPQSTRLPTTVAAREELQERLEAIDKAARDNGVQVKQSVSHASTPPAMIFLRETKQLLTEMRSGARVPLSRLQEFTTREWMLRHGEEDSVKEARREEGDIASRKAPDIQDVERADEEITREGNEPDEDLGRTASMADERPEALHEDAGEEGVDVQSLDGHDAIGAESPDEHSEEEDTLDSDRVRNIAADEGRERDMVRVSQDDIIAGKNAAGSGIAATVKGKGKWEIDPVTGNKVFRRQKDKATSLAEGTDDISDEEAHRVEQALEGKDIHGVASWLAENASSPVHRYIAKMAGAMIKRLEDQGVKFSFNIVHNGDMAPRSMNRANGLVHGQFTENNHTVDMYLNGADRVGVRGVSEETALHELVHAATQTAIEFGSYFRPKDGSYFSEGTEFGKAVRDLKELQSAIVKHFNARVAQFGKTGEGLTTLEAAILRGRNALTNTHETVAWGLTNPEVAAYLETIPYKNTTMWGSFVQSIRRLLGMSPQADTALSELLRISDKLLSADAGDINATGQKMGSGISPITSQMAKGIVEDAAGTVKQILDDPAKSISGFARNVADRAPTSALRTWANKLLTNDQMRQSYERLFSAGLMRDLNDLLERADVRTHEIGAAGDKLVRELVGASRLHEEQWPAFQDLLQDVRLYEVRPDEELTSEGNSHLDQFSQGYAKHAELKAAYDALPEELQKLYKKTTDFFTAAHSAFARQALDEHMIGGKFDKGYDIGALKERLHSGTLTDQDKADLKKAFGETKANALTNAEELRKSQGPYTPLSRRGDYVVQAEHDIKTPTDARRITGSNDDPNGRTFEFTDKGKLQDWLKNLDARANVREVRYDPDNGKPLASGKKGAQRLAEIEADPTKYPHGADIRWRATVETKHVEFLETQAEAVAARQALEADPAFRNVQHEQRRSQNPGLDLELSGSQVQSLVRSLRQNGSLSDAAKKAAERSLIEASIQMQRGNRAMKHQLRAKKISGASDDIVRGAAEYNQANSRARARMEFEQQISDKLTQMKREVRGVQDSSTLTRSEVANEMEQRVYGNYAPDPKTPYSQFMNHLMTLSFIKRMASPAHLLLHMTHPWMISAPVLAARHGAARTALNLTRAYRDMGAMKGLGEGFAGAKRLAKDISAEPVNFIDYFKKNLAGVSDHAGIAKMLDELSATNRIHPEAGMEVQRMAPGRGRVMAAMDRVDGSFRQLTQATESINRVAEAIAAYRMELQKTGSHESAVRYAGDTLANTQGLYSRSNMAPLFRNPTLKPFLQFKQFPQMIYHLLGRSLYNVFKGETKEIRAEAAKQFAGVIATHVAMAGALGLPMEVIKAPVMLANALGVSNTSWDDVERQAYMEVAKKYGAKEAEVMMHGLSRAMGPFSVDVHHRLGLNSLFFFGEPESSKPQDSLNYLLNFVGGAPASMALDTMAGAQSLMKGNFEKGAEQILPVKAFTDVAKAARYYTEGKKTGRGLPDMEPVSAPEAFVQALGFKPGEVAHHDEARNAAFRSIQEQKSTTQSLIDGWANATGKDKDAALKQITAYNQMVPSTERITMQQLTRAMEARKSSGGDKAILGITTNGRDRRIVGDIAKAYGTE